MKKKKIGSDLILAACDNDEKIAEFFIEYMGNGMNAKKAYKKLHPVVTEGTAAVLGHEMLKRVNRGMLLEAKGLGLERYLKQLDEGLKAEYNGEPDHRARNPYHERQGRLLGVESSGDNINNGIQIKIENYGNKNPA